MSALELGNDTVPSSLGEPRGVFACSFLQGGRGKTVVCNFVPLGPRLCFLMCALGMQVSDVSGCSGWCSVAPSLLTLRVQCQITNECFSLLGNGCGVFGGKPEDNPGPWKHLSTLALSFSNGLDRQSAFFPGTQQLSLAPGDFVTTKSLGHVTQTNSAGLVSFLALAAKSPRADVCLVELHSEAGHTRTFWQKDIFYVTS